MDVSSWSAGSSEVVKYVMTVWVEVIKRRQYANKQKPETLS